jgi:hypothetical protein
MVPGVRAVEMVHVDPEASLTVYVAKAPEDFAGFVSALKRDLKGSGLLTLSTSAARARVTIRIEFEPQPVWVVMDQSQAELMPRAPVSDVSSTLRIRENLETIWRYQKILEMRNENSSLQGKVDFVLLKKDAGGQWETVADDAIFEDGESVAFRITNRSGSAIHVSVLDLGISKRINLLHPVASASETIEATRSEGAAGDINASGTLTVGQRPDDEIELYFPENLTFLRENGNGHLCGREIFKLCVTTGRHDLRFLNQAGVRIESSSSFQVGLEQKIYLATGNGSTRETKRPNIQSTDDWLTMDRSFLLRKKI